MPRVRLYKSDLVELAFARPAEPLRAYVRQYAAWFDRSREVVSRRHLPSGHVPLIINFDAPVRERKAGSAEWMEHRTFTAGLHDAFTLSESAGPNHGIQIDFTAVGARLFYNRPLGQLANRSVALTDLIGCAAERLAARLFDASTWEERFAVLDREIGSTVFAASPVPAEVSWAWRALTRSEGRVRIADLVRHVGWSERHFATQFRDQLGLTPKAFARVLRFGRAVRTLSSEHNATLADVALSCGYYDQAHFTRDFQQFAGVTPLTLLDRRLPSDGGFSA